MYMLAESWCHDRSYSRWMDEALIAHSALSSPSSPINLIHSLAQLDENFDVKKTYPVKAGWNFPQLLPQKNWMPLPNGKELYFVHSFNPLQLCYFDFETGFCEVSVAQLRRQIWSHSSKIVTMQKLFYLACVFVFPRELPQARANSSQGSLPNFSGGTPFLPST